MAQSTELSGFVIPKVFTPYVMEQSVLKNGLVKSGIIVSDPTVTAALAQGGDVASILTFKNIDVTSSANATTS